jgi:hypothetical protein
MKCSYACILLSTRMEVEIDGNMHFPEHASGIQSKTNEKLFIINGNSPIPRRKIKNTNLTKIILL